MNEKFRFEYSKKGRIKSCTRHVRNGNPIRTKAMKRLLVSGCEKTNIEKNRNSPTFLCIDYLRGLQQMCTKSSFSTVRDFRVVERSWHGLLRIFSLFVRPANCPPSLNLQIFWCLNDVTLPWAHHVPHVVPPCSSPCLILLGGPPLNILFFSLPLFSTFRKLMSLNRKKKH